MIKKCIGCGSILQTDDKNKVGYIREDKIVDSSLCERCFKLTNYGEFKKVNINDEEYNKIFKNINSSHDLTLYLVDIFNINSALNIINYIDSNIILVITKYDIIPKSVKENKIISKIKEYILSKNIIDIVIVSAKTNYNMDKLFNMINKYKISKNVFILGNANAGKSTLINKLISNYSEKDISLTTSIMPSTTISTNEIEISDDLTIIDTPGFIEEDNISNYVSLKELKKIMPNREIRPITYQIEEGKTLLINPYLRIEYVKGEKNSFTFYISNDIIIDRINTITNNRGKELSCHEVDVKAGSDVIVNGLCFIKITKDAKLKIYTISNVGVYKRKSLI